MLVLSRAIGEGLVIDDDTRVYVVEANGEMARFRVHRLYGPGTESEEFTLRKGERHAIDGGISIVLTDLRLINGKRKVRIGIDAPREAMINRDEVYEAMKRHAEMLIDESNPAPQVEVAFGPGFNAEDIENCLEYLSLLYRLEGGVGLKVVGSESAAPELAEVPNGF